MYTIEQGERIATVTLEEGTTAVKFPNAHSVYGVKGDGLIVSLRADAEEGDDGTYNTADGDGQCLIAHYTNADTIYITGSGSCVVWGGQSPLDCPFKKRGKGGEIELTGISITENGTYTPPSGKAYGRVDVSVITPAVTVPLTVTENGTYTVPTGVDGFSPVTVNVQGIDIGVVDETAYVGNITIL